MAIRVLIGGQDVTSGPGYHVVFDSTFRISEDILNDQWEADFNLRITNKAIPRPRSNVELQIYNGTTLEFAGVLADPQQTRVSATTFNWRVKAGNYKQWFDRHLVAEFYGQQSADGIVKAIVSTYCPGFTTNNVQAAPVVAEQKLDYKAPSRAIKDLANLLAWGFYIDYSKDVHFFLAESIQSPLPGNALNADTDLVHYGDLALTENGTQVKNTIVAKEFKVRSATTVPIYIVADGQNDTFYLPQEPAGTSAKYFPTLTVGGTAYAIKPDVAGGLAGSGYQNNDTAYINSPNRTIRLDPKPAQGTVISGTMYYKYQPIYVQNDPALIQNQAAREGTDGIYEYAVSDPRMTGDDLGLAQARTGYLLAKYGSPNLTGTMVSYVPGWRAGQYFYLNSEYWMDGLTNRKMYVAKVIKSPIVQPPNGDPVFKYTLTLSDRPYIF